MLADSPSTDDGFRRQVRFYLLDHESYLGKAIDVALLVLNLVFVGVYVAQTYPVAPETRSLLWRLEVAIGVVFATEYALRLYGAADRLGVAQQVRLDAEPGEQRQPHQQQRRLDRRRRLVDQLAGNVRDALGLAPAGTAGRPRRCARPLVGVGA